MIQASEIPLGFLIFKMMSISKVVTFASPVHRRAIEISVCKGIYYCYYVKELKYLKNYKCRYMVSSRGKNHLALYW